MMSVLKVIALVTIFTAFAGIHARKFPGLCIYFFNEKWCFFFFFKACMNFMGSQSWSSFSNFSLLDYGDDVDVITANREPSFRNIQIKGFLLSIQKNVISNRAINIIGKWFSKVLDGDDYVQPENLFRPPLPSPPPPKAPSGPIPFSRIKMPSSFKLTKKPAE